VTNFVQATSKLRFSNV